MQTLIEEEMTKLCDTPIDILQSTRIASNEEGAFPIFKDHGFEVDGKAVFITEKDVRKALDSAPHRFTVMARDPEKSVVIGDESFALVPAYGPPLFQR